jgi:hypothetical protein
MKAIKLKTQAHFSEGTQDASLPPKPHLSTTRPEFKILYLLVVALAALFLKDPLPTGVLLALQVFSWLVSGIRKKDLNIFRKTFGFALSIVLINSFFSSPKDFAVLSILNFDLFASTSGFLEAMVMVVRFYTILCASVLVRSTTSSEEFTQGLVRLKLSKNMAQILDAILSSLEGKQEGQGKGQGKSQGKKEYTLKGILKGDFTFLVNMVQRRLDEAKTKFIDFDWAVISAVSIMVVGIRMIKILPGIPIAPGHKNIIVIPLFILVATLSKKKFSATYVGFLSGVISFMFGFGKYGILGIVQFMVPGLIVDLMIGLSFASQSLWMLGLIGFCAGMGRVSAEILMALVFGLPKAFYLFFFPLFISQSIFGLLSAPLSKYLLKHFPRPTLESERSS